MPALETGKYTTPAKVAAMLRLEPFTENTLPTLADVTEWITWAEEEIDNRTHAAWRNRSVDEPHSMKYPRAPFTARDWLDGIMFKLPHRYIRTVAAADGSRILDTTQGDKIEVWNGATWNDWLTAFSAGHSGQYWVEPRSGRMYMRGYFQIYNIDAVRVTYRYGQTYVPADITRAATLLVAAEIVMQEDVQATVAGGGDENAPTLVQKAGSWRRQAEKIIVTRTETRIAPSVVQGV